jgi:hypothetical protein
MERLTIKQHLIYSVDACKLDIAGDGLSLGGCCQPSWGHGESPLMGANDEGKSSMTNIDDSPKAAVGILQHRYCLQA